jgi:hypothetical protein
MSGAVAACILRGHANSTSQHQIRSETTAFDALADQKHGRHQCLRAWVGPQHAQKAKFLNLQFEDRGKIKLEVTFPGISSN